MLDGSKECLGGCGKVPNFLVVLVGSGSFYIVLRSCWCGGPEEVLDGSDVVVMLEALETKSC